MLHIICSDGIKHHQTFLLLECDHNLCPTGTWLPFQPLHIHPDVIVHVFCFCASAAPQKSARDSGKHQALQTGSWHQLQQKWCPRLFPYLNAFITLKPCNKQKITHQHVVLIPMHGVFSKPRMLLIIGNLPTAVLHTQCLFTYISWKMCIMMSLDEIMMLMHCPTSRM